MKQKTLKTNKRQTIYRRRNSKEKVGDLLVSEMDNWDIKLSLGIEKILLTVE